MELIKADSWTSQLDLLLADGTVVYRDGLSRWYAVSPSGDERYLGTAGPTPAPTTAPFDCACYLASL